MRCASRADRIGAGRALARLVGIVLVLAIGVVSSARAQSPSPSPTPTPTASPTPTPSPSPSPTPTPTPTPTATMINSTVSSGSAVTNLGSYFLERIGTTNGFSRMLRTNPARGGAADSTEAPRYRTWFEGYAISC